MLRSSGSGFEILALDLRLELNHRDSDRYISRRATLLGCFEGRASILDREGIDFCTADKVRMFPANFALCFSVPNEVSSFRIRVAARV